MDDVIGKITNEAVNVQVFAWRGGPPAGGFDQIVDGRVGGEWIGRSSGIGISRR